MADDDTSVDADEDEDMAKNSEIKAEPKNINIPEERLIVIAGPTASGKSNLALSLAEKKPSVIINADSLQIYKDLNILTAFPSDDDRALAPHELYGFLPPHESYSAVRFAADAANAARDAWKKERIPVVVGGTGLYLKALLEGFSPIPDVSPETKEHAERLAAEKGNAFIREEILKADPSFRPTDPQRILRAYSVLSETGKPLSFFQKTPPRKPLHCRTAVVRIELERDDLYARCDARFSAMMKAGALDEVRAYINAYGFDADNPVERALGFSELKDHLKGRITLDEAETLARQKTRNYAKRQETWFKHQLKADYLYPADVKKLDKLSWL